MMMFRSKYTQPSWLLSDMAHRRSSTSDPNPGTRDDDVP
nr:MAG TPA: hypothetical protein [Caudoviricetes sp.]